MRGLSGFRQEIIDPAKGLLKELSNLFGAFDRKSKNIMRGGKRSGAGRPKGSLNNRTRALKEKIELSGVTPMDITLATARALYAKAFDGKGMMVDQDAAIAASQEASRTFCYLYPRLAAVDFQATPTLTHEEALEKLR